MRSRKWYGLDVLLNHRSTLVPQWKPFRDTTKPVEELYESVKSQKLRLYYA
jgi:hypothetical protein